jgi:endonuclease-3
LGHIDKRIKFNQLPAMSSKIDWSVALRPLLKEYKGKKHPLHAHSVYQSIVMVVLSAQSTDDVINKLAPELFAAYPTMESLARASPEDLWPYVKGVRNFANKAKWLVGIARQFNADAPLTLATLTRFSGIGRKSANVILREAGRPPEGIIVDLHVVRVVSRLGITRETDPVKIEEGLMKILPREEWDAGMALSFLGREICRPKPECEKCLMNTVCAYYAKVRTEGVKRAASKGKAPKAAAPKVAASKGAAPKGAKKKATGKTKK